MSKLRLALYAVFTLVSLVIIVDFVSPGRRNTADIIKVERELQSHYNASQNYHYSYRLITKEHGFQVSEEFSKLAREGARVEYSVSRIFTEINWYRLLPSGDKSFYSMRIGLGLALPLLALMSIFLSYRLKTKNDIPVVILQILLIGDLIFLVM
ncbi:MAG: hypothetical protein AAF655_27140 [Bacteroidota bacterium]